MNKLAPVSLLVLGVSLLPWKAVQAAPPGPTGQAQEAPANRKGVRHDVKAHADDPIQIRQEKKALYDARGDWYQMVHEHGLYSPEAKAAKAKMLHTQAVLHEELREELIAPAK